eukprot:m.487094 g.487094  ORF g.487094 m.487094 type:complete len:200 (+) comp57220_c1_seq1:2522-3121(+)
MGCSALSLGACAIQAALGFACLRFALALLSLFTHCFRLVRLKPCFTPKTKGEPKTKEFFGGGVCVFGCALCAFEHILRLRDCLCGPVCGSGLPAAFISCNTLLCSACHFSALLPASLLGLQRDRGRAPRALCDLARPLSLVLCMYSAGLCGKHPLLPCFLFAGFDVSCFGYPGHESRRRVNCCRVHLGVLSVFCCRAFE